MYVGADVFGGETSGQQEDDTIASLVADLGVSHGMQRRETRQRLIDIGQAAVPALIAALSSPSENVRWEAAKALGEIRDPRAAPALMDALEDTEPGVRWLAEEALIALGRRGLLTILEALEERCDSRWLCDGAHHVLHTLIREGVADEARPVLEALEDLEPAVEVPVAAYHALQLLREAGDDLATLEPSV
jgi:hypothetical protein